MNEFQKLIRNIFLVMLVILLHSLIYGSLVWFFDIHASKYGYKVHENPFWFVCLTANLFGIMWDMFLIIIGGFTYGGVISPLIEAYKESYPKKPKESKKTTIEDKYKQQLLKGFN